MMAPKILRSTLIALAVSATVLLGWFTWHQRALDARAHRIYDSTVQRSEWREVIEQWVIPEEVHDYGLQARVSGNAAEILWPDGARGEPLRCPYWHPMKALAPQWDNGDWRERLRAAARCPHLDRVVEAASYTRFDLADPEWTHGDPARGTLGLGFVAPRSLVGALLARGRARIESGDREAALLDYRAVVSMGIHLWQRSPRWRGLQLGNWAIVTGLDHIAWVYEQDDRLGEAARVRAILGRLPGRETCRGPLTRDLPRSAILPEGIDQVAGYIGREDLPLAVRVHAFEAVAHAYLGHPTELLLGPSTQRVSTWNDLAGRHTELLQWTQTPDVLEWSAPRRWSRIDL